ncbi:MAG TPA: hypothetical protein VLA71_04670 [Algoriphagus sp.]|nr:hypothetical protein [Algoriphagus sp.]
MKWLLRLTLTTIAHGLNRGLWSDSIPLINGFSHLRRVGQSKELGARGGMIARGSDQKL